MGNRYTKSYSLSFEVLERLEKDAEKRSDKSVAAVLEDILQKHYALGKKAKKPAKKALSKEEES